MSIEQIFYQYNPWWEKQPSENMLIKRETLLASLYPLMDTPDIIMLTGLRRVGKTATMKCLIHHLIEDQGIPPERCLYISMDDYHLSTMTLASAVEAYRKLMKLSFKDPIYVFFDEITYLKDFQIQLKNLYDKGQTKCIVSSSSSSVLKDDSAHLTGRKRIIEINPLSFEEYCLFKKIQHSKADQHLYDADFEEYMQVGGMPEYVLHGDREYLVSLIDDIIMKDIVAHHSLRNPGVIREFFILLMERAGKQISINKMSNILKISTDTAKRYLGMFEDTYLIHLVSRAGKTNETLLSTKKIYATDIGMRNIITGFRDKGAIFENCVFMRIKNKHPQYVLTDGQEIDFLVDDTLIEVKYGHHLEGSQRQAFENHPAQNKLLIQNHKMLEKLDAL